MREAKIEGLGLEAGREYEIPAPAVPGDESEGCKHVRRYRALVPTRD